jgi:hypothetical protein
MSVGLMKKINIDMMRQDSPLPVSQSAEVSLTRFVISKYLPSFPSIERRTRLHLPYSGSLGHHFPTFPVLFTEPSVLCSAKTAKSPSQVRSLFAILP